VLAILVSTGSVSLHAAEAAQADMVDEFKKEHDMK